MTTLKRRLVLGAIALILMATAGSVAFFRAAANPGNNLAVDAVSGGTVDLTRTVTGAVEFDIGVNVTEATTAYVGYQARIRYDSTVINFVPVTLTEAGTAVDAPNGECTDGIDNDDDGNTDGDDPQCALAGLNVKYLVVGGLTALPGAAADDPGAGNLRITTMGSSRNTGVTSFVGQVVLARYRCVGIGTTSLHLVSSADDPGYYSTMLGAGGTDVPTTLTHAEVTCTSLEPPATPTPTSTSTPTRTPTPIAECVFTDVERGNQFLVNGAVGRFIGTDPEIDVMDLRLLRTARGRVVVLGVKSGMDNGTKTRIVVTGNGMCPRGPGKFQALKIAPLFWRPTRWLLVDVTPGS
jgi:hypothetical protein